MKKEKTAAVLILSGILLFVPATKYGGGVPEITGIYHAFDATDGELHEILPQTVPLSQSTATFPIKIPHAVENAAEIDVSNAHNGYFTARYLKTGEKQLRVIIESPGGARYIYKLRPDGQYEVFPVSDGNGNYRITVYENVFDNMYSAVLSTTQSVLLSDEHAPFLRPNQYVNYSDDSIAAKKAAELTRGLKSTTDKIEAVYLYVMKHLSYDNQLAGNVEPGYIPDVDKVLQAGSGICFDYAVVTAAMLRSQGIPAKLVVGYRGQEYHAWISAYSAEAGWVDDDAYFGEGSWEILDPTMPLYSGGSGSGCLAYQNKYTAKFFY